MLGTIREIHSKNIFKLMVIKINLENIIKAREKKVNPGHFKADAFKNFVGKSLKGTFYRQPKRKKSRKWQMNLEKPGNNWK